MYLSVKFDYVINNCMYYLHVDTIVHVDTIDSRVLRGYARYVKCTLVSSFIMLLIIVCTTKMLKQLTVAYYEVMQGIENVP